MQLTDVINYIFTFIFKQ